MQKRGKKRNGWLAVLTGAFVSCTVLTATLCLMAILIQSGAASERVLRPLLLAGCLLSALAGCMICRGSGRRMARLLSGAVPTALILCCCAVFNGGCGIGKWVLLNSAALMMPCLVSLLRGNSTRKRKR